MLLINLGTNDMNKYTGPEWGNVFIKTYVDFVQSATTRYAEPLMPVFVAQGNYSNELLYDLLQ